MKTHFDTLPTADRWRVSEEINRACPNHWQAVEVDSIASIQNGCAFESTLFNKKSGMPLIRIRDVGKADTETYYTGAYEEQYIVKSGDILVGMDGEFRCRRWTGRDALLNQRVCRIDLNEDLVDADFFLLVIQPYISAVESATSSITVRHLSSRTVQNIKIALPPLAEQRRLSRKLMGMRASTRKARSRLGDIDRLLEKFRQSVLASAFRGDLTADWRAQNPDVEPASVLLERIREERRRRWEEAELAKMKAKGKVPSGEGWKERYSPPIPCTPPEARLPEGWSKVRLQEIVDAVTKGSSPRWQGFEYSSRGIPFVRSQNVRWRELDLTEVAFLPTAFNERESKSILKAGDVLLNIVGASIGRATVATAAVEGGNVNQAVAVIRPIESAIIPALLVAYLLSPSAQRDIHSQKVDVARANFSLGDINDLMIPFPPRAEQDVLISRIDHAIQAGSTLEELAKASVSKLSRLDQSILAKAFRGELVPQDPNDEPASKLLERIRAAKPEKPPRRGRRPSKPRSPAPAKPPQLDLTLEAPEPAPPPPSPPPTRQPSPVRRTSAPFPDADDLAPRVHRVLLGRGALERDEALREAASALRDGGVVDYQRLRRGGPLYVALDEAVEQGMAAGLFDEPSAGEVRAVLRSAREYTPGDWRRALLACLDDEPAEREDVLEAAAAWAAENMGLEFQRLRRDGVIVQGLKSALRTAIRRGEVERLGAREVRRA